MCLIKEMIFYNENICKASFRNALWCDTETEAKICCNGFKSQHPSENMPIDNTKKKIEMLKFMASVIWKIVTPTYYQYEWGNRDSCSMW